MSAACGAIGARKRRPWLAAAVALAILIAADVALPRLDALSWLMRDEHPTSFFAGMNSHLVRALRSLAPRAAADPRAVVLLGNSQFVDAGGPTPLLADALVLAGAPAGTPVLSLCVLATCPTDHEIWTQHLGPVRPGLVLIGLGAADLGTPLDRARKTPVVRNVAAGFADGLVEPATWGERFERWARSVWWVYRHRVLLRELVLWPTGPTIPTATLDQTLSQEEFFTVFFGSARAAELIALRAAYEEKRDQATLERYLELLRGPSYLDGVRGRWRDLTIDPLQVQALTRAAERIQSEGGQAVWVLLPENPALERDPTVGSVVRERSDAFARRLAEVAAPLGVVVLDLRRSLDESAFVDLNHVFFNSGAFVPVLARALAAQGLLAPGAPAEGAASVLGRPHESSAAQPGAQPRGDGADRALPVPTRLARWVTGNAARPRNSGPRTKLSV